MVKIQKQTCFIIIKICIAVIATWFLIEKVRFTEIQDALFNPQNPGFLCIAMALLIPNLALQWYRWYLLLKLIKPDIGKWQTFCSLMGGMIGGFITPGRVGEASRTLFLTDINRYHVLGLLFIDKIYAFVPIVFFGIWGIVLMLFYLFNYNMFLVWPLSLTALFINILCLTILLRPDWIRNLLYNLSVLFPTNQKVRMVIEGLDYFRRKNSMAMLILSFIFYGIYILQFSLLAFAFELTSWTTALTATTSTILVKTLLPVSFADLGIREGAALYFFLKFDIQKVTAFNSALLLFFINVLIPAVLGFLFIPKLSLGQSD